jgi:hypothetical protein
MKNLAFGAHPDDIEIYMFGTLAAAGARSDGSEGTALRQSGSLEHWSAQTHAYSLRVVQTSCKERPNVTLTA